MKLAVDTFYDKARLALMAVGPASGRKCLSGARLQRSDVAGCHTAGSRAPPG